MADQKKYVTMGYDQLPGFDYTINEEISAEKLILT